MNTHRMNITIPKSEYERIKTLSNKSAYIAGALREKLDAEEKAKKAEALAIAYRQASQESDEDWDALAGDGL